MALAAALPPVEQVRPGLWSLPVPIPNNPLRYVLVYVLETARWLYLIDAGWNTDDAYVTLCRGLSRLGAGILDVRGVLATHVHPDHYGLAGRVREASGAWVALHGADAALLRTRYADRDRLAEELARFLIRAGAPADAASRVLEAVSARSGAAPAFPDVQIEDGERPDVPGWELLAIWTPGHSPGHMVFHEPSHKILFSGDHVLPRITPNVSFYPDSTNDPLAEYVRALRRLRRYETREVLPAHEHRFSDLGGRIAQLLHHHRVRLAEVLIVVDGEPKTAWQVAHAMRWSIPWERVTGIALRSALGEAMAHLRTLERRRLVRELHGEPSRWVPS